MKLKLIVPQVHLNGDTEETLMQGLGESHHSLTQALEVMRSMAPNARNYYTLGSSAYSEAADQYAAMCKRLHETQSEIEAIADGIQNRKDYVDHPLKGR